MRTEYITAQREKGRKVVGVMPILYPKEMFTAHNTLAVEIWGPPGIAEGPEAGRIQTYVCSVVRNALAFIASGKADVCDAVFFPHTCDSIQGLATLAPDFGGWSKPPLRLLLPKGEDRPSARKYMVNELKAFAKSIEDVSGRKTDEQALADAVELHEKIDAARGELLAKRAYVDMSDRELYTVLRRGEFLWPEEHLEELGEAAKKLRDEKVQTGAPIMITGYVPEPMSILDQINEAGAYLAADDYAAVGRRVVAVKTDPAADPYERIAARIFDAPPCATRAALHAGRIKHLDNIYERGQARGLIMHIVKFCEPELFDVPVIRKHFEEKKTPQLYLEGELEKELSGQTITRLEAFLEMLDSGQQAA